MTRIENIYFGGPQVKRERVDEFTKTVAFDGVLYLTQNPELLNSQINSNLSVKGTLEAESLIPDISTDAIIRVPDLLPERVEELGDKALCGLESRYGIEANTLRNSKKYVLVAGERFGEGSGREQAVLALKEAGITAVIAPSFGPIFEKNSSYLGLLTSTNLSIASQIQSGEAVGLEEFIQGKPQMLQEIIISGGLFNYLRRIKRGEVSAPEIKREKDSSIGMNIFEQRLAKAFHVDQVLPGDTGLLPINLVYSYVGLSGLARSALFAEYGEVKLRLDPKKVYLFEDHFAYSKIPTILGLTGEQRVFAEELGMPAENYYKGHFEDRGGAGICHRVMLERIDPRSSPVVVATDSHTPTIGALPILAIPVGSTEFAASLAEGQIPFSVKPTLRVEFKGKLPKGHSIRDAQLELAGTVKPVQSGMVVEYGGPGLNTLSLEQVAALCNMVPEVFNAEIAVTESYEAGINYLQQQFGITPEKGKELYGIPEANSNYAQEVSYDLSRVSPWIALPGRPNNAITLARLNEYLRIDKAYIVSCTLGLQDLAETAAMLLGRQVVEGTKLLVTPSSVKVREQAQELGIIDILKASGATISDASACLACIGQGPEAVEDNEVAITASNRNYPGRMGDMNAKVFMAGPPLTSLSAILGRIPTLEEYQGEIERFSFNLQKLENRISSKYLEVKLAS